MHKMLKAFAACAAGLLLFAGGRAGAATKSITVSTWGDLRTAVANAASGDTLELTLDSGYANLQIDGFPAIAIDKPLTIKNKEEGRLIRVCRTSVEGHGAFVVTTEGPVTIQGFDFSGAEKTNAVQYEGCIRTTTGDLTLRDCWFYNWEADYRYTGADDETLAGAVTARGAKLTLESCTFLECSIVNYTSDTGCRIQCAGAVSSFCHETLVKKCTFFRNTANDDGGWMQTGGLYVDGGDYNGNLLIADSTFGANGKRGLFTWIDTAILNSSFVNNGGAGIAFRPVAKTKRLRMANALVLKNNGAGDDIIAELNTEDQILMTHTVFGACSSAIARSDCYCAGKDNLGKWFLDAYGDDTPVVQTTTIRGIVRFAYPLSAWAYADGRNVAVPLLYDGNEVNPTVYAGLSMKDATRLWYGETTGSPTLHTQGVDDKDCQDYWWEETYYFSCGSAMSHPVTFKFKDKSGNVVATKNVMWNYGTLEMPSNRTAPEGYVCHGWNFSDGTIYAGDSKVQMDDLQALYATPEAKSYMYIAEPNEFYETTLPISYTIEYRGFNAAFDPEYHRVTGVVYDYGATNGTTIALSACPDIEAFDYANYGYVATGWATSKERAQAGLVDYALGQTLGANHDGGVNLTSENGATVTLWIVRTPNQGYVRFYSDSSRTDYIDYPYATRQNFTIPECTFIPPAGYQFKDWSYGVDLTRQPGDVVQMSVPEPGAHALGGSYWAEYEASKGYTITYNSNDRTGRTKGQVVSASAAQPQTLLTADDAGFDRSGYTFLGWSESNDENNAVDYTAGRSAWGLTKDSAIALYAVWQITEGSWHTWTTTDSKSGKELTYVWEAIDSTKKTCRLTRVIGGTAITANWTLPDVVRDLAGNAWNIVAYADTIVGDLAYVPEITLGLWVTEGAECLRYDNGTGIRQKILGFSFGATGYFCSDDGILYKFTGNGQNANLAAVPCNWNNGTGLLDIPAGYTSFDVTVVGIASNACSALKNITTVVIPETVTWIADDAFANNYGTSPFVAGDGGISQVYFHDFDTTMMKWSVPFKETDWNATACQPVIRYDDKVVIGFMPCEALEGQNCTVVVPEGVPAIADYAFQECGQMEAVTLPSTLKSIGEWAFESCYNLTAVDIPAAVTNVGDYAFMCTSLAAITGGEGLLATPFSVGYGIVDSTPLSEDVTYATIGTPGEGDYILLSHDPNDTEPLNLLPGLVGIAGDAVNGDETLATAELPETVRWVGDYAFDDNPNLTKIKLCVTTKTAPLFAPNKANYKSGRCTIEVYGSTACDTIDASFRVSVGDGSESETATPFDLVIGSGIAKITGSAFAYSLEDDMDVASVTGGDDLVRVDRAAFAGTTWATTEASAGDPSTTGYPHRNIGSFYVGYFADSIGSMLTMPETDTLTGASITRISPTAFSDCSFSELVLASQLEAGQVTPALFEDNTSLISLAIDAAAPNYTTEDGVLYDKAKTTLIVYPRERAGDFTLPDTVATIEEGACQYARINSLTVTDASALTSIPAESFANSSVASVTLGARVAIVGANAFNGCSQLQSVTFGQGLSRVENYAFLQCDLRTITLPRTLDAIGTMAFANNFYLESVTFVGDAPTCDATAFEDGYDGAKGYVAADSKGWNGDPTSSELPDPAVWNGLALEKLQNTFANWAAYNGLTGDNAAYTAKPAKWGGAYENAFVYLFGEEIVDGSKQLLSITMIDGVPRITTPKELDRDDDDFPYVPFVAGSTDVGDWSKCTYLTTTAPGEPDPSTIPPEGYDYWWLNSGDEANFFRIHLRD